MTLLGEILSWTLMGDEGLKSVFLFVPLQVILAITSTSETVIPTKHKICIFSSFIMDGNPIGSL